METNFARLSNTFIARFKIESSEDLVEAIEPFFAYGLNETIRPQKGPLPELYPEEGEAWLKWEHAIKSALPYLGTVCLLDVMIGFEATTGERKRIFGLAPGFKYKRTARMIVRAREFNKERAGTWMLKADRRLRSWFGDDDLYMSGSNNRPVGSELASEVTKLFYSSS